MSNLNKRKIALEPKIEYEDLSSPDTERVDWSQIYPALKPTDLLRRLAEKHPVQRSPDHRCSPTPSEEPQIQSFIEKENFPDNLDSSELNLVVFEPIPNNKSVLQESGCPPEDMKLENGTDEYVVIHNPSDPASDKALDSTSQDRSAPLQTLFPRVSSGRRFESPISQTPQPYPRSPLLSISPHRGLSPSPYSTNRAVAHITSQDQIIETLQSRLIDQTRQIAENYQKIEDQLKDKVSELRSQHNELDNEKEKIERTYRIWTTNMAKKCQELQLENEMLEQAQVCSANNETTAGQIEECQAREMQLLRSQLDIHKSEMASWQNKEEKALNRLRVNQNRLNESQLELENDQKLHNAEISEKDKEIEELMLKIGRMENRIPSQTVSQHSTPSRVTVKSKSPLRLRGQRNISIGTAAEMNLTGDRRDYEQKLIQHQIEKYKVKRLLLKDDLEQEEKIRLNTELGLIKECVRVLKAKLNLAML